ncbi:MAG: carbon storage regulator, partial [Spirochaetes bacterium]|nr:carbon storage regulator [Spirochaetota bacterium]
GDHAKIGIRAPIDVKVYRKEIYEEIQAANIQASKINPENLKNVGDLFKKDDKQE